MTSSFDGYDPIRQAVQEAIGAPLSLWTTGGGCMALIAELEGGAEIVVTDSEDTLSSWDARAAAKVQGTTYGYAVGVYAGEDGHCGEAVVYVSGPRAETPEGVVALVRHALELATQRQFKTPENYEPPIKMLNIA